MAVVATASVPYSSPGAYLPLMVSPAVPVPYFTPGSYLPRMLTSATALPFGSVGSYDLWPSAGATPVNYYQRVWSVGSSVWCYYTKTVVDPTPLSTETTPNWVGSSTSPSVVRIS